MSVKRLKAPHSIAGLTPTENRILLVLLNPENRLKTARAIMALAECSDTTYYRAFSKEAFVSALQELSLDIVKQAVLPTLHAFIKEAARGSFPHGKVILEMARLYPGDLNEQNYTRQLDEFTKALARAVIVKPVDDGDSAQPEASGGDSGGDASVEPLHRGDA